jgi:hypothetical protein
MALMWRHEVDSFCRTRPAASVLGPGVRKDVRVRISPLAPYVTCGFALPGAPRNAAIKALKSANANQVLGKISLPISVP